MAIDKSKENSRIADLLAMGNKVGTKIAMGIQNPAIYKQFIGNGGVIWDYAVAAGLLEKADAEWIKNNSNIVIKMNITYKSGVDRYEINGSTPVVDSMSLEIDQEYTITIIGSNGQSMTISGVAQEETTEYGETAIIVGTSYGMFGISDGNWIFSAFAENEGDLGDSITIIITEGGDTPK